MVHMYKKIISQGLFYIFLKILIFQVVRGLKGQIMVQNDKKILSVALGISAIIHHMIIVYGTPV